MICLQNYAKQRTMMKKEIAMKRQKGSYNIFTIQALSLAYPTGHGLSLQL